MAAEASEFREAEQRANEALRDGIRAFAAWLAKYWGMTREEWEWANEEPAPPQEWFDGHRAALDSVPDAVAVFLEEVS